jgi:hypothetical protein
MRQGSAVSTAPVDGTYTGYTANPAFGSGTQVGTGNYVVYKGTGTSVAVTGLTNGTTYYVAAYEYKGTLNTSGVDQGTNYKSAPATGSQGAGSPTAPTLTTPTATAIDSSSATLGANVTFDGGAAITSRGTVWGTSANPTGNQVAAGGTTGSFTHARSGLTAGTRIYYRGYATNSAGTGYSPDGSFYTEPATQASGVNFSAIGSTGMTVNWTRGTGDGVVVLMRQGSAVSSAPVDGTYTTYAANSTFGSGSQIGSGNNVVYRGTGTGVAVAGLSSSSAYYVAVYEYKGLADTSGGDQGTNYKPAPATGGQTTAAGTPPAAPVLLGPNSGYSGQVGYSDEETVLTVLQWNASSGATQYYCEVLANDGSSVVSSSGWTTGLSHDPGDLLDNTDYYWRVKARNANGESGWSPTWSWYDAW